MSEEVTHVYVGARACGCRVCLVADMSGKNKKYTAKSVAEYIRDGYNVTRETLEAYRENPLQQCTHGKSEASHD